MKGNRYRTFPHEGEAKAFREGIEFVSDSSIEIVGVFWVPGPPKRLNLDSVYVVHVIDKSADNSERQPPRWSKRDAA